MKVVVKGEMTSSKNNFRNVGDMKVDILIERIIKRIRKKLKIKSENSSVGRA